MDRLNMQSPVYQNILKELSIRLSKEGYEMKPIALSIIILALLSIASAVELGGQAGKDTLASLGSGCGLWDWGAAPIGKIADNGSLIAGAWY